MAIVDRKGASDSDRGQRHRHVHVVETSVELSNANDLFHREKGQDEVIDARLGYPLKKAYTAAVYANVGRGDR